MYTSASRSFNIQHYPSHPLHKEEGTIQSSPLSHRDFASILMSYESLCSGVSISRTLIMCSYFFRMISFFSYVISSINFPMAVLSGLSSRSKLRSIRLFSITSSLISLVDFRKAVSFSCIILCCSGVRPSSSEKTTLGLVHHIWIKRYII